MSSRRPARLSVVAAVAAAAIAAGPATPGARAARPAVSVTQTTADLSQRLARRPSLRFARRRAPRGVPVIDVSQGERMQSVIGAGGAMTDASAWLIWEQLSPTARARLMEQLFSPGGIHLGFLRAPMGASDFSATGVPYTYDDQPPGVADPTLAHFSVAHDEAYLLPALRAARAINPDVYLESMPWSPPAWMKSTDRLDNLGHSGQLLPTAYGPLAQYFVRFLQAYAAAGVPVDAIAPQNEPNVATAYPGMELSGAQEAAFVADDLAPALRVAHLHPSVFGWDLSWGPLAADNPLVGETRAPRRTLTGVAWHCYFGSPSAMSHVHALAPDSRQLVDECSTGAHDVWSTSELLIASFRHWASAVGVWNLALDPAGGPVQPPNAGCPGCTGVVTVDERTHSYSLSRDYYELGQLSRFVAPGAVRIASDHFVGYDLTPRYQTAVTAGLDDVAFENPDGTIVLLAYDNAPTPIRFAVRWRGRTLRYTMPAGATTTFTWR